MAGIDEAGLPATVSDALKIRPSGDPEQKASLSETEQEKVDGDTDFASKAVFYLPFATYVWSPMVADAPDVSWWTWVKVKLLLVFTPHVGGDGFI